MRNADCSAIRPHFGSSAAKVAIEYVVAGFSPRSVFAKLLHLGAFRTRAEARDYIRYKKGRPCCGRLLRQESQQPFNVHALKSQRSVQ